MTILQIEDGYKTFQDNIVLKNICLSITKGKIIGISGPNASGKSTLFNIITGYERFDRDKFGAAKGQIKLNGKRIDNLSPHRIAREGISRTFQQDRFFSEMTVEQNLRFAMSSIKRNAYSEPCTGSNVSKLISDFKLDEYADYKPTKLSQGLKRLLSIAFCFVIGSKIILLDEPFSGLDNSSDNERESKLNRIKELIQRYAIDYQITFILISHLDDIFEICNNRYYLKSGKLEPYNNVTDFPAVYTSIVPNLDSPVEVNSNETKKYIAKTTSLFIKYGKSPVINNANLSFLPGYIYVVQGENGTGKSSILLSLAGLLPELGGHVESGDIEILQNKYLISQNNYRNSSFYGVKNIKRNVALICDIGKIFLTLSVLDNMLLSKPHDLDREEFYARISHLSEMFGDEPQKNIFGPKIFYKRTDTLTGGQLQRLRISRALLRKPKLILADEPFNGLDPSTVFRVKNEFERLRDSGVCIIVIDHSNVINDAAHQVIITEELIDEKHNNCIQYHIKN